MAKHEGYLLNLYTHFMYYIMLINQKPLKKN